MKDIFFPEIFKNMMPIDEFLEKYFKETHKSAFKGFNNLNFDDSFTTLQDVLYLIQFSKLFIIN